MHSRVSSSRDEGAEVPAEPGLGVEASELVDDHVGSSRSANTQAPNSPPLRIATLLRRAVVGVVEVGERAIRSERSARSGLEVARPEPSVTATLAIRGASSEVGTACSLRSETGPSWHSCSGMQEPSSRVSVRRVGSDGSNQRRSPAVAEVGDHVDDAMGARRWSTRRIARLRPVRHDRHGGDGLVGRERQRRSRAPTAARRAVLESSRSPRLPASVTARLTMTADEPSGASTWTGSRQPAPGRPVRLHRSASRPVVVDHVEAHPGAGRCRG